MAPPTAPAVRLLALGDSAWTLEFGQTMDPDAHAQVIGLAEQVAQARRTEPLLASVTDVVPTFRSLTLYFDPLETDAPALGERLLAWARQGRRRLHPGRLWHLPVCFDADFAPDLPALAAAKGLAPNDVIQRLLGATYRVYLIGFQPGFPYMGGLPLELHMPRLASPRHRVPAQSVAVAGAMCSVYPWETPGGWHLLGRTPVVLFDLRHADQPAMLAAGDAVRWYAVDRTAHDACAHDIAQGLPREAFLKAPPP